MRNKFILLAVFGFVVISCKSPESQTTDLSKNIPSLESLSGKWVSIDTVDMEPSLRNFRAQALTNKDMTSLSWFASAPYSGGYHTGTLKVNGETPLVTHFRWQPYQALRRSVRKDVEINSATRMVVDKNIILWEVTLKEYKRYEAGVQRNYRSHWIYQSVSKPGMAVVVSVSNPGWSGYQTG
jgi:hypothetical protein